MSSNALHRGHRERMRQRFLETGVSGFHDHEILELLLFYAIPRKNTNEITHELLNAFGSISAVLDADIRELSAVKVISGKLASMIKFMRDLCRSYAISVHCTVKFNSTKELKKYISDYFRRSDSDMLLILSLNTEMELLSVLSLSDGRSDDSPEAFIRRIAEAALRSNLHRIVIARSCSESRPLIPTEKDYSEIRRLADALSPLGIEVYDYVLCSFDKTFSMRSNAAFEFYF